MMAICEAPDCGQKFKARRSDARFCSTRCRMTNMRSQRVGQDSVVTDIPDTDTDLSVTAVPKADTIMLGQVARRHDPGP
jgi:endogenous inhibitor of DNA gyrase (YacG/DUF329 family)